MEWKLLRNDPIKAQEYFENKMRFTLGPAEVKYYRDQGTQMMLIDVRAAEDFAKGHIPGAINLPESTWSDVEKLKTILSKDAPNVIYCYSIVCHLAAQAAIVFARNGFSVIELEGGYESWSEMGLEQEKAAA